METERSVRLTVRIESHGAVDGHSHLAVFQDGGKSGVLVVDTKVVQQVIDRIIGTEVTQLREQNASLRELEKCECVINTNWHEGVPYDYKVTCSHCDNQLQAANNVIGDLTKSNLEMANDLKYLREQMQSAKKQIHRLLADHVEIGGRSER